MLYRVENRVRFELTWFVAMSKLRLYTPIFSFIRNVYKTVCTKAAE